MQYSSCINFFIFIYPIVGYIYQSTGSQGSHFREDKFHIGSTGSWCQCKSVPGQIQNDGREEVSVFYFCIILSCFPDNGAREDLETVYFVASLISQQWINTLGPPCWPDFSLIICEWSRDAQALWSCLLTCMPSFAPALGFIQGFAASEGQAHCVDSSASCPLSACLTLDVRPFCVSTRSQMS